MKRSFYDTFIAVSTTALQAQGQGRHDPFPRSRCESRPVIQRRTLKQTIFLLIVFLSITLPLHSGWLIATDFARITYSSKPREGHASFDDALKEMSKGGHIQKLVVIDFFLLSDEALQKELFAGLAHDAPQELKEALASSGNMHNSKIEQLRKPFEKVLLATPTIKRLSASLAVHGLTISRVGCEKFSLISTSTAPNRHLFGNLWLDVAKAEGD